jgi:8-amino-7-oxononanoate synthase
LARPNSIDQIYGLLVVSNRHLWIILGKRDERFPSWAFRRHGEPNPYNHQIRGWDFQLAEKFSSSKKFFVFISLSLRHHSREIFKSDMSVQNPLLTRASRAVSFPPVAPATPRQCPNGAWDGKPSAAASQEGPELPLFDKVRNFTQAKEVRAAGFYPYFRTITSEQDTEVVMNGRKVLMLGSNSYLGLTNHPRVKEAAKAAVDKYGTGCAGSRFLNGTLDLHLELEQEIAQLVGKEAVLLYSTGFQVNIGVASVMVGKDEFILADRSNHASLVEGCRLALGRFLRFPHNDMDALETRLERLPLEVGKIIIADGVFSMEGDIIKLPELCALGKRYNAAVMVDDAHGLGVLGQRGAGTSAHFGLTDDVHFIMSTFSKSLASLGGFIASDAATIDFIKHHSRSLVFSASMSPANAAAARAALQIMISEPERLEQLWQNTCRMKEGLLALGFEMGACQTPILPVYVRDILTTFRFAKRLEQEGVFVNPVVSPGVPPGHELIRISLMATHTDAQIDRALEILGRVAKESGIL